MSSVAQQIREALIAEVKKVTGIGEVSSDWNLWDKVSRFPAAIVILDTERHEQSPTQSKTITALFRVACTLRSQSPENDFDTLKAAIETQIEDDPTLGGLTAGGVGAFVSGCGPFATSKVIAGDVYVRNVYVDVEYRHPRGQP